MLRNCFVVLYLLRKGLSTMKKIGMKFLSVLLLVSCLPVFLLLLILIHSQQVFHSGITQAAIMWW